MKWIWKFHEWYEWSPSALRVRLAAGDPRGPSCIGSLLGSPRNPGSLGMDILMDASELSRYTAVSDRVDEILAEG